tara:strand:+ start:1383 stop:2222 length:840 start_codon:yes stop_codon:yes gene_type:complete
MAYFTHLPLVDVRTSSYRQSNVDPYTLARNIFRRIKIRESLEDVILGFDQYTIQTNERPDQVAFKQYGSMQYDWVVLLCNNIINVYEEWPMAEDELERYIDSTYEEDADSVHHWVTQRITDQKGRILVKADRIVPEDYTYTRPDGTFVPKEETVRPISVYDHEAGKNDYKRNIYLLRKEYVTGFIEEFTSLVGYLPNSETDATTGAKRSVNTTQEQFQTVKPTYSTNIGETSSIEFASEADYSSKEFDTSGPTISEGDVLADGSTVAVSSAGTGSTSGY